MCMRIRLNKDKVIVGQGSGCSVPRGDMYICIYQP